jgi:hypothetical protein
MAPPKKVFIELFITASELAAIRTRDQCKRVDACACYRGDFRDGISTADAGYGWSQKRNLQYFTADMVPVTKCRSGQKMTRANQRLGPADGPHRYICCPTSWTAWARRLEKDKTLMAARDQVAALISSELGLLFTAESHFTP